LFSEAEISHEEFEPVRQLLGISAKRSDEIFNRLWSHHVGVGKIDEDGYWKEYLKQSKNKPSIQEIKSLYRSCIRPNDELLELVKKFSRKYEQYVVSNHGKEWMDYLVSEWELKNWFKDIFCSAYLGVTKPDKRFFKIALERAKGVGEKTLYIDDNKNNIKSAGSFGISGIVYRNNKDLFMRLSELGIL